MPETIKPPVQFRIKFDVPHKFALEPGYVRNQHCHDFRPNAQGATGTWHDPNTGLVTLLPSFLTESFHTSANWKPLDQWIYSANFWDKVYRAGDATSENVAHFFSTVGYQNSDVIGTLDNLAIAGVSLSSAIAQDEMVWVMQSQFDMARDEGFVWHYRAMTDERHTYRNWFRLQWDNIELVFSYDGRVRAFLYGDDKTQEPKLIDDFPICLPNDIAGKEGYIILLPVPGYGLNVYHSHSAVRMGNKISSARAGVTRGHLISLPDRWDNGTLFCHNGGKLSLGMSLRIDRSHQLFGYHQVNYPTTPQVFIEDTIDPGYKPTNAPLQVIPSRVPSLQSAGISCELLNGKGDAPWTAGVDRQGQIKTTLSTTSALHTPYLLGTNVYFNPVFAVRDTTPITIEHESNGLNRLWQLDFTDDEGCAFEGSATIYAKSDALRRIIERGDTTFELEKSLDGGVTWHVHNGGLAKLKGDAELRGDETQGFYCVAQFSLVGMEGRFDESTQTVEIAGDGVTAGDVINAVHAVCALEAVPDLPAAFSGPGAFKLPGVTKGQNYRFVPRPGDKGDEIIRQMLFLLRKQFAEWRHYYDWEHVKWVVDQRPRDVNPAHLWTLTPFEDEAVINPANATSKRVIRFGVGGEGIMPFKVYPPEANLVQPQGLTSPDPEGKRILGTPIDNRPSQTDKTSPDYLGRVVVAVPSFLPLSDLADIDRMGRTVYDAACHREIETTITARDYVDDFTPGMPAQIRTLNEAKERVQWLAGQLRVEDGQRFWLKRRSVAIEYNDGPGETAPTVIYTLSTTWESRVK